MTLADLIRRFRVLADDRVERHFWEDEELIDWFNDAQRQACIRGRLIHESDNPAITRIALTPGQATYPLHPAAYEITHLSVRGNNERARFIDLVSTEWLDKREPEWRDLDHPSCYAIQTDKAIRLVGTLHAGDVLRLECFRLPLVPMIGMDDEPEIHEAHHEHLIQWVLHRAFGVPDSEAFNEKREALAEQEFTRYFGPLPDSDMRRISRTDAPHHNVPILP